MLLLQVNTGEPKHGVPLSFSMCTLWFLNISAAEISAQFILIHGFSCLLCVRMKEWEWGGDVGGWCTPGVGEGGNKCNLESVDGSNTLGQSVSINGKKSFVLAVRGCQLKLKLISKSSIKRKETQKKLN